MSLTYLYKRGDTAPAVTATLSDSAGPLVLTGHTVRFIMSPAASGSAPVINALASITNPTGGGVSYTLQPTDLAVIGTYRVEWEDTDAGGLVRRVPTDDFDTLIVGPNAEDEIAGAQAPPAVPVRPLRVDFEMVAGNRKVLHFALPLRNENGVLIDVSQYLQVWCYAKYAPGDSDAAAVIAKTKGAGVGTNTTILVNPTVAGTPTGVNTFDVYVLPADTAALSPYPHPLCIECRALVTTGDIRTIAIGWLKVNPGMVQAIT